MPVEVRIPTLGESVTEGVIVRWLKQDGDTVKVDDALLELETDKASVEIPAPTAGVLKTTKPEGATVQVGEVIATIEAGANPKAAPRSVTKSAAAPSEPAPPPPDKAAAPPAKEAAPSPEPAAPEPAVAAPDTPLSPAVRRLVEEHGLQPQAIEGTGKGGRLTKADVLAHVEAGPTHSGPTTPAPVASAPASIGPAVRPQPSSPPPARPVERVAMTPLRKRIAERLVQAQHTAAILTTFNEIDMTAVMALRTHYKDRFKQTHGVGLGFMSFFAKACIAALHEMPLLNAFLDGTDIVLHHYVNLGIAVGTERGLVVPVVHNAEQMTFAQIEKEIERLAGLARDAKLGINDLSGGTFTISNGGVYGSLMSTPILNPPQSAILGMHKIEKRPVVINDQIVIRPMMYAALSYDHRLVDGELAVSFLVKIKERIEDPARMLLEV